MLFSYTYVAFVCRYVEVLHIVCCCCFRYVAVVFRYGSLSCRCATDGLKCVLVVSNYEYVVCKYVAVRCLLLVFCCYLKSHVVFAGRYGGVVCRCVGMLLFFAEVCYCFL